MAIWHVAIGKRTVCEIPPALAAVGGHCSHNSRADARRAVETLKAGGRKARVVDGECPTSERIAREGNGA